jgi:enolase
MRVKSIEARPIFATNSQQTIEVEIETDKGKVRSSVPIGTSTGKYEVKYLPVDKALTKIALIRRHFLSEDFADQREVDEMIGYIDKSDDLHDIGGNVTLGISSAFLKAFALEDGREVYEYLGGKTIPRPICNVAGGWNKQDIQEFLLMPVHQKSFHDSITTISSAYTDFGKQLKAHDPSFNFSKNLESGWATRLDFRHVLDVLSPLSEKHGLKIGLDVAATHLWNGYDYIYSDAKRNRTTQLELMNWLSTMYPVIYFEDPFHEDDFLGFSTLTHEMYNRLVCGDDLFATNLERLKEGLRFNAVSAVIVKPNQVGTMTGVMKFVEEAKRNRLVTVMSHRSGETDDTLICHLAVGLGCDYIKIGISGERTVKINEMLRIEEKLKPAK